jgi:hypothetical protein
MWRRPVSLAAKHTQFELLIAVMKLIWKESISGHMHHCCNESEITIRILVVPATRAHRNFQALLKIALRLLLLVHLLHLDHSSSQSLGQHSGGNSCLAMICMFVH